MRRRESGRKDVEEDGRMENEIKGRKKREKPKKVWDGDNILVEKKCMGKESRKGRKERNRRRRCVREIVLEVERVW